mgnify:CR=1 FL=1
MIRQQQSKNVGGGPTGRRMRLFKKYIKMGSKLLNFHVTGIKLHGNYAPNILTNECDVLIAIGMRFDDRVTGKLSEYAKQAKVIHFEIDPAEINKNVIADVAVLGDSKETLSKILPLIKKNEHRKWRDKFTELSKIEFEKVIEDDLYPTKVGLTMGEVLKEINLSLIHI